MIDNDSLQALRTEPAGLLNTAVNIFTSPSEAFTELQQRPRKLFPLLLILSSLLAVMFWYFSIVDFDWYIDDLLSGADLEEEQLEQARQEMTFMPQSMFGLFSAIGAAIATLTTWLLQSGYLSLASALSGDRFRFSHWFSLVLWTSLPSLLSIMGMAVNIALSPNGQLNAYDLDPTTLASLGMQSNNAAVQGIFTFINLALIWGVVLTVLGYRQWLQSGWTRALSVVLAPYILIFGVWAYFALIQAEIW